MADKRTWLDGPNIPGEYDDMEGPGRWPGEKLGLPESGPGSLAPVGRRAGAVAIDWIVCMLIANLIHMFTTELGGVAFLGYALWAVSYTHLTLPTTLHECRSRWSPYH